MTSQPDGGVEIAVGARIYEEVSAIEDPIIRDLVQASIDEWHSSSA
jgi:hypothetical protein